MAASMGKVGGFDSWVGGSTSLLSARIWAHCWLEWARYFLAIVAHLDAEMFVSVDQFLKDGA